MDGAAPLPSTKRPLRPSTGQRPLPARVGRCKDLYCPLILPPSGVCRTHATIPIRCRNQQPRIDPVDNRGCGLPHAESGLGPVSSIQGLLLWNGPFLQALPCMLRYGMQTRVLGPSCIAKVLLV